MELYGWFVWRSGIKPPLQISATWLGFYTPDTINYSPSYPLGYIVTTQLPLLQMPSVQSIDADPFWQPHAVAYALLGYVHAVTKGGNAVAYLLQTDPG